MEHHGMSVGARAADRPQLTEQLEASMGWSRSTTLTLLRRMVGKGVVTCDTEGTKNTFSPRCTARTRRLPKQRPF